MFSKLGKSKSRFVVIGLMLVSMATVSCVFEPRATTKPSQSGGKDILPAQEPEMVISNLVTIVQALDSANYPDLFTEDFYFVPDPEDVDFMNNHYGPGVYLDWDKFVESDVASQFFDRINAALLYIEDTEVVEDTPDTYIVYHGYTLKILPQGGTWTYFGGRVRFHLRQDPADELWYMFQWYDFRLEEIPDSVSGTWGLSKGEIRATT